MSQLLELIVLHLLLEHLLFWRWLGLFFLSFSHLHLTVVDAVLFLVLHLAVLHSLVVVVRLIVLHLLAIDWHLLLVLVLLLEHQQLLLLGLIQDIDATFVVGWWWDALREVSELIQLVEVLSALDQDLLIIVQVVVGVDVGVTKKITVLLEVLDLIIEVDEFLSLLLNKQGSFGNVEFHDGLLLGVGVLGLSHVSLGSQQTVFPRPPELLGVIGDGRRPVDSAGQSHLLDGTDVVLLLDGMFRLKLCVLAFSPQFDKRLVLFGGRWVRHRSLHQI